MAEGIDWIFRPIDRGWCRFESYVDGTLHIEDVALICDALDVLEENQTRADDAAQRKAESG